MRLIMNRTQQGATASALALLMLACTDTVAPDLAGDASADALTDAARVASVVVTFSKTSIVVGEAIQAKAVLRDRWNRQLSLDVTWSSSNPAVADVSTRGVVTGRSPGSVSIIASHGTKSGSASLAVRQDSVSTSPAPVASVTVVLADSSLNVGQTAQGIATTRDANNNVLTGRSITWTSSNPSVASVSPSGLVTAIAAGSSQISANSEGKSASAPMTAADTSTAPPPGSVEPAGMTAVTQRPFSTMLEDGWGVYAWSGTTANCAIASDPSAPKSPASIASIKYPAGFPGGGEPCGWAKEGMPNYRTWYLSFWFQISQNWQGHPTAVNKMLHVNIGGSNHIVVNLWGSGPGMMQAGILLQGIVKGGNFDSGTSANFYPNLGPSGEIVRGRWYHEEVILVGNTSGTANGSVDWWLDGVKVGSRSGIQYVSGNGVFGEKIAWAPTWGGLGSTVSSTMYQFMDHIYVSGK
jgi:hypothetical protein